MINRVKISDYRCFREIDVPLGPMTVLIGPNNSGKTAFLSALNLAQSPGGAIASSDRYLFHQRSIPTIELFCDSGSAVTISPSPTKAQGVRNHEKNSWQLTGARDEIVPIRRFGSDSLQPRMTSEGIPEKMGVPEIDDAVSNLPSVLDALLRKDRTRFDRIQATLKALVPGFAALNIATPDPKTRRIDLEFENALEMRGDLVSYGVQLMIFFVTLANHPSPPRLALFDEPETGVHPKRLEEILKLLRGLSEGGYADYPTQIVMTTHSPYLLDSIDIAKDQVLVAQRCKDGSSQIAPVAEDRLSVFLDEFMLGEVWLNQGEAGLLTKEIR